MNEKVLEAFDKKFSYLWQHKEDNMLGYPQVTQHEAVKAFIIKSLSDQRKEICKEVEKLKDMTTTEFGEETVSRLEVLSIIKVK